MKIISPNKKGRRQTNMKKVYDWLNDGSTYGKPSPSK